MTRLLLIRHGRSTWNATGKLQGWADPPLDETGLEQVRRLAQRLVAERHTVAALYSSPQLRASQTAAQVAAALGLAVQTDDRLKENDVGQLTGLTGDEVAQQYPDWVAQFHNGSKDWLCPPGGEERDSFAGRVASVMGEIVERHPEDTVAVVCHGGTLGVYLMHLLDLPTRRRSPFQFDNTSLSIVSVSPQRVRLLKLNDTAHLADGCIQS